MALKDFYNTGDTTAVNVLGTTWRAQEFLATSSYYLASIKLLMYRVGSPGDITVSLRDTDEDGKPTGSDIDSVTGTTDGDTLTTNAAGEWREITLSAGILLTSGEKYAIVVRVIAGDASNYVWLRQDGSPPYYSGGKSGSSTNSGSSWSAFDQSYMFEAYSDAPSIPSDQATVKRLIAVGNNEVWYEDI